jgi:predicted enzyme related to lactoylglutathione lyase
MSVNLYAVTFDCGNAGELAGFWSGVLGRPVEDGASAEMAAIAPGGTGGPHWYFMQVAEGKIAKNRMHPDLTTADLGAEIDRIVALGAKQAGEFDEAGFRWVTLQDPEGNEFDVIASEG